MIDVKFHKAAYGKFFLILTASIFVAVVVSLRPDYIGTDTQSYREFFSKVVTGEGSRIKDPFFVILAHLSLMVSEDYRVFFFFTSFISTVMLYIAFWNILRANKGFQVEHLVVAYIVFMMITMVSPFFLNGQTNIIRSLLATSFLIYGCVSIYSGKKIIGTTSILLSVLSHVTTVIFLPFLIVLKLGFRSICFLILVGVLFYVSGVSQVLVVTTLDFFSGSAKLEYYSKYFSGDLGYNSGVRYDFLIFSLFFWLLFASVRRYDSSADFVFKLYSALFLPFLAFGFIPYSDRLLFPVWTMIPFGLAVSVIRHIALDRFLVATALWLCLISMGIFAWRSGFI